ncbi:MAG: NUDIX domain-containing protein [Patescibacteria group bacterium]
MTTEPKDKELHRIAITAIIYNSDKKYLLIKRSHDKKAFPGKWTVPGGGLEVEDYINEKPSTTALQWYGTIEKTLRREVKEETGLEISKPEYLLDLTFIRPDGIPVLVLSYYARYISGVVKLDADSVDYKWATLNEAKETDLIDGIYGEIEMVDQKLKSNS